MRLPDITQRFQISSVIITEWRNTLLEFNLYNLFNIMDTELMKELMNDKGVALVEFYATWCPHCQAMMPVVEDVKALLDGRAKVYQFDIDKNEKLADEMKVNGIPTFIVFKNGEPVWRGSGEMDGNILVQKVEAEL